MTETHNYWIKKLLFPKKILIDEPGIITNCVMRRYGGIKSRQRVTVFFEDIISNLQMQSIKKLGKAKASKIWYDGGKAAIERYFFLACTKAASPVIFDSVLTYVLNGFQSSGFSALKNYKKTKNKIVFNGNNNIICRKTGDSSFMCGFLSGTLGSLTGSNFKVVGECKNCPEACSFSCTNGNTKYNSFKHGISVEKYNADNFPEVYAIGKRLGTFRGFMKFNKIDIKSKNGLAYKGKRIILTENGCFELPIKELKKAGGEELMEKGIKDEAEKICASILSSKTKKEKMNELLNLLSAFGWGKPSCKIDSSKLRFKFLNPPINKCGSNYLIYLLNGFINNIFEKKFKFDKIKHSIKPFVLTIDYIC